MTEARECDNDVMVETAQAMVFAKVVFVFSMG